MSRVARQHRADRESQTRFDDTPRETGRIPRRTTFESSDLFEELWRHAVWKHQLCAPARLPGSARNATNRRNSVPSPSKASEVDTIDDVRETSIGPERKIDVRLQRTQTGRSRRVTTFVQTTALDALDEPGECMSESGVGVRGGASLERLCGSAPYHRPRPRRVEVRREKRGVRGGARRGRPSSPRRPLPASPTAARGPHRRDRRPSA